MFKNYFTFILIAVVSFSAYSESLHINMKKEQQISLEKLKEFHKRDGLANFFLKIKISRKVQIAYFGGSITAADNGWRNMTFSWFQTKFPQTIFCQTNGTIGGTGSDLGVFRIEHDILEDKPDLVFVEFAVNDGGKTRAQVLQTMEGIIRKIWKACPNADICFVYTIEQNDISDLVNGKIHPVVRAMEELADYYGIPSIHMGIEVARLFKEGKLLFAANPVENQRTIVFTQDHCHPLSESGHPLYAATVVKYMDQMKNHFKASPHFLATYYLSNNWEDARMINISNVEMIGNWTKLPNDQGLAAQFSKNLPSVYKGMPGSKLNFKFKGIALGLYDIIGPGTGMLKIRVDSKEQKVIRFDRYCSNYRLNNIILFDRLENVIHTVEIEILEDKFDKGQILKDSYLTKYIDDKGPFFENSYLLGDILIVGELIKSQ